MKLPTACILLLVVCFWSFGPPALTASPILPPDGSPASPQADDGFWLTALRLVAGLATVKFVVGAVVAGVIVKSTLATLGNRDARSLGFASATIGSVTIQIADIFLEAETDGFANMPFGHAEALVDAGGTVRFTNTGESTGTVTATVSPSPGETFDLNAGSPASNDTGFGSVDLNFGPAQAGNPLAFNGPPLFSFHRETSNGPLTGSIPEQTFTFNLNPGQSVDLFTEIQVGGNADASSTPEPSTLALCAAGAALMAVRRYAKHARP
jgi:hypothetical protein